MIFGGEILTYEAYPSGKSLCEKLLEFNPLSVAKSLFDPQYAIRGVVIL